MKGVPKNFRKIHGEAPVFESPQACNFSKKVTQTQVFSCEFCEIFKNIFFIKYHLATASVIENSLMINLLMTNTLNI